MTEKEETPAEKEEKQENMDLDLIEQANLAADRVEVANKRLEHNIHRLEQIGMAKERMKVEDVLGGKSTTNEPPKEETASEYAEKVMANEAPTTD